MARYAKGKKALLIEDRFGRRIKYKDARTEWTGMRVYKGDFETKHPQLEPNKYLKQERGNVLLNPRPDNDRINQTTTVRLGPLHGGWSGSIIALHGIERLSVSEDIVGLAISAYHNADGVVVPQVVSPSGIAATSAQGTAKYNLGDQPDGISATVSYGTITIGGQEDAEGLSATASQGTVIIPVIADPQTREVPWGEELYGADTWARPEITATAEMGTAIPTLSPAFDGHSMTAHLGDDSQQAGVLLNFTISNMSDLIPAGTSWGDSTWGAAGYSLNQMTAVSIGQSDQIKINLTSEPSGLTTTSQQGTILAIVDQQGYGENLYGKGDWGD